MQSSIRSLRDAPVSTPQELLALINRLDGAGLIAVNVRNPVALDPTTHCLARGTLFLLTEGLFVVETALGRHLATHA